MNCSLKKLFEQGKQGSIDAFVLWTVFAFKSSGTFSGKSLMEFILECCETQSKNFDENGFY